MLDHLTLRQFYCQLRNDYNLNIYWNLFNFLLDMVIPPSEQTYEKSTVFPKFYNEIKG